MTEKKPGRQRAEDIITKIQSNLTDDLLKSAHRREKLASETAGLRVNRFFGYCYVASEALYHLWGKYNGFKPHVLRVGKIHGAIALPSQESTHWYLRDSNETILDPTAAQFGDWSIPYHVGRSCAFLTKDPSKRCQRLMATLEAVEVST
jgi:hypothetical protein